MRSLYQLERDKEIDELINLLKESEKEAVRARAAEILINLEDSDGIDAAIESFYEDESKKVKTTIADAVSSKGDLEFIKQVMEKIEGFDSSKKATWTLLKNFKEALRSENPGIRLNAAYALGEIDEKPSEVVKALITALEDLNDEVKKQVIESLGKISHPKAIEPLIKKLDDDNPDVRRKVVSALSQMNQKKVVDPIIDALDDKNASVREEAAMALADFNGKKVINTLIKGLKDKNNAVQEASAFSLMETMSNVAANKSHKTREEVAEKIEKIEKDFDYSPILMAVKRGVRSSIKKNAIWLTGEIGDEEAVQTLVNLLDHKNNQIRRLAATSLSKICDEAPEELIKALKSKKLIKKRMAAYALGEIGDKSVLDELKPLIDSDKEELRKIALKAYGKLGGEL